MSHNWYKNKAIKLDEAKYELKLIRSSRLFKMVDFSRSAARSPFNLVRNARSILSKEYVPPLSHDGQYYSQLGSPLPLYKYPNIKVCLATKKLQIIDTLFLETCTAQRIENNKIRLLLKIENGIDFIVTDTTGIEDNMDYTVRAIDNGVKIILLLSEDEIMPDSIEGLVSHVVTVGLSPNNDIQPFADIYRTEQRSLSRSFNGNTVFINTSQDIGNIGRNSLNVISKNLLKNISFADAIKIINAVLACKPIVVDGIIPDWLQNSGVLSCPTKKKLADTVQLLSKPYQLERYALQCSREVTLTRNSLVVMDRFLPSIGVRPRKNTAPTVGVIASTMRIDNIESLVDNIEKQSLRPKEVVIMLHGVKVSKKIKSFVEKSSLNIKIKHATKDTLFGDVLNNALDEINHCEFITKMDDDDMYGKNHILDLYIAFLNSRADIVGKNNNWTYLSTLGKTVNWMPDRSFKYNVHIPGATIFMKTCTLKELRFGHIKRSIDSELLRRAEMRGAITYSTHKYNFVRVRHDDHTYKKEDDLFIKNSDGYPLDGTPLDVLNI